MRECKREREREREGEETHDTTTKMVVIRGLVF